MLRPDTLAFTVLLAALMAIGPFSTDMYLASLPDMARLLSASPAHLQLTLSLYLFGFACGQITYGPFADRHGRKPVLTAALSLYTAATIACAVSTSADALIAARFFQALGGAGAIVLARAIVRDLHSGARAARELARMSMIMALAPIVAPLIGGVLHAQFGWRASFVVMIGLAAAALAATRLLLPETLRLRSPDPVSFAQILRSFGIIIRNRAFLAYLGMLSISYSGLFAWISASSFVIQDVYGLSALGFSLTFSAACSGFIIGATLGARLVSRFGIDTVMGFGAVALAAGGVTMLATVAAGWKTGAALAIPCAIYLCGLGLTLPQSMAAALTPFPDRAGAASSLMGFVQQTSAAVVGVTVGHFLGASAWPMAIAIGAAGCLTLLLWIATHGIRRRANLDGRA